MTVKETAKLLAILKAAFPKDFPYNMSKEDAKITCIVWAEQFMNIPYEIVEIAVKQLISKEDRISVAKVNKQLGALYFEACKELDDDLRARRLFNLVKLSDKDREMYEFIKSYTEEYKCPSNVLSVAQIVGENKVLMIGGAE